jgi:hypothetical protein
MLSYFKKLFGKARATPARRVARRKPLGRGRLGIEILEDRLALSGFQVMGDQLLVTGTAGNDVFQFTAGSSPQVTLNDDTYTVDPTVIHKISFDGVSGADTATITDSTGYSDQLSVWRGGGTLTGSNYTLSLTNTPDIQASVADGTAYFWGISSSGNVFVGTSTSASMYGTDYYNSTSGFGTVVAYSVGGPDTAIFYGSSSSSNTFVSTPTDASMTGSGYSDLAYNFATVYAYAGTSNDLANLYGSSSGGNTFAATPTDAYLSGSGYLSDTIGFRRVNAFAGTSSDVARLSGSSSSKNIFTGVLDQAYRTASLSGSNYENFTAGFGSVYASAGTSSDVAYLYGSSSSSNTFEGTNLGANLTATGYLNSTSGFGQVYAYAGTSSDVAKFSSLAFYGSKGTNAFVATPTDAYMTGSGYYNEAFGFGQVEATADGPDDTATFYGSSWSSNTFVVEPTFASMGAGTSYHNVARYFGHVYAYAGTSSDAAYLYGSSWSSNTFVGTPTYAYLTATGYYNYTYGFSQVYAFAGTSSDVAYLYGGNFVSTSTPDGIPYSYVYDSNYYVQALQFHRVSYNPDVPY